MMSGGDLDGDVYLCIWDEEIVGNISGIADPAEEIEIRFKPSESLVRSEQIIDLMRSIYKNDRLGHLSHLHLALCDKIGP